MNIRTARDNKCSYQRVYGRRSSLNARPFPFIISLASLKKVAICAVVLASVYGSWYWMSHSQYLCLNKIVVEGGHHLSHDELLRLTCLTSRTNLLRVSLRTVEGAIGRYPWVESATAKRKLPDQLAITIKERIPIAILNSNNKMYLVDRSGYVFKEMTPDDTLTLPVISGAMSNDIKGRRLSGASMRAIELVTMAGRGARTLGANNIKKINISNSGDLMLYTADHGICIHFKSEDIKMQFARAEKILFQLYRSGNYERVASIDLDYDNNMALARLRD